MIISPDNVREVAQGLHWYCEDFAEDDNTLREVQKSLRYVPGDGETKTSTIAACNIYEELISGLDPHDLLERIQQCQYLGTTLPSAGSDSPTKPVRRVDQNSE